MVRVRRSSKLSTLRDIRVRSIAEDGFFEAARHSRSNAFHKYWAVHNDYEIVNGLLIPRGKISKNYFPAGTPDIVQEFQRLAISDHNDPNGAIVSFARRWGQLGHDKFPTESPEQKLNGDPVGWILNHSRDVNIVLGLVHLARIGDQNQIGELLDTIYS